MIIFRSRIGTVDFAVEFDSKPLFYAIEVEDVIPDAVLAAEFAA